MLKNWLKIALTNYQRNKFATLITTLGMAIGLTAFMLIFSHWKDEESYESWNPEAKQVYLLQSYSTADQIYGNNMSYLMVKRMSEVIPEVEDYVLINGRHMSGIAKTSVNSLYIEEGMQASPHFFKFFPFHILYGDVNNALQDISSIALSKETSKRLFGTENSIGKTLSFEGKEFVVTVVYQLPEGKTEIKPNFVYLSKMLMKTMKDPGDDWGNFSYTCLLKLKKDADPEVVCQKIYKDVFLYRAEVFGDKDKTALKYLDLYGPNKAFLTPLNEMKLYAKLSWSGETDTKLIFTLMGLSVLLLIMSSINFINLKTAQASQRAKEVGVRKALGSGRAGLIGQFLFETFLLTFIAYLFSLALAELILPFYNQFMNKEITLSGRWFYLYSGLIVLVVTLVSGLLPALYLSKFKAIDTLKGNFARSKHGIWLRNIILALQLVISSFFVIGTLVVTQQVRHMMNKDLGFQGKQIYIVSFNQSSAKPWLKYELLKNELKKIKGVVDVSYSEAIPGFASSSSSNFDWENHSVDANHGSMDYNFFKIFNIPLAKGRNINPNLASDTVNSVIVNEAFVKKMGWTDNSSIGQKLQPGFDDKKYVVIGIVKDFNLVNPRSVIYPTAFFHYKQTDWKRYDIGKIAVQLDSEDMLGTQERIKNFWETKIEPGYPFKGDFVDKKFNDSFIKYQKQQLLFGILNILVLAVALLGLFALSSLMIEQKLKDVAIKKTLGAPDAVLIKDLTKKFLWITAIAVLLSFPISYFFLNEWLKDFAYRIEMPWWPYMISMLLLLILTLLVVSIKAYAATKVQLVKYLKYE